jgi:hypothetical protein
MLNPLLNYRRHLIDDKLYSHNGQISEEAGPELLNYGYLAHSPTFKLGRSLLNEVFYLPPHTALRDVQAPTLSVHDTKDTFIPVESSRWAVQRLTAEPTATSPRSPPAGRRWSLTARHGSPDQSITVRSQRNFARSQTNYGL